MTIQYKQGNILFENIEALVNPVNCVGVMGRGLALQFTKMFSENFKAYALACKNEQLTPGNLLIYQTGQKNNPKYIINFPTKNHWREKSRIEYIDDGLLQLAEFVKQNDVKSIAIPPLGCGLGGLNWADVKPKIVSVFIDFPDIKVIIFEPIDG